MIHAGANAGVYELKAMAFETMESFLRAGVFPRSSPLLCSYVLP
jgi:delta-aminolevulinic acid dehydratase/porphobilinogen synthase